MAENGSGVKIYVVTTGTPDTNTAIGGELNSSISINQAIIDVSDKDSDWLEKLGGQKDWSVSGSFNIDESASGQQTDLFEALVAGTAVKIFIGKIVSSSRVFGYLGDALIESVSISFDKDASSTKDISFQGSGELTKVSETTTTTTTQA